MEEGIEMNMVHTLDDRQIVLNQVFISEANERGYWDYDATNSRFLLYVYDDDNDLSSSSVVTFATTEEQALKKQERFIKSTEYFSKKRQMEANMRAMEERNEH